MEFIEASYKDCRKSPCLAFSSSRNFSNMSNRKYAIAKFKKCGLFFSNATTIEKILEVEPFYFALLSLICSTSKPNGSNVSFAFCSMVSKSLSRFSLLR